MNQVKVIDLNDKVKSLFFVCLEDWSEDMKEAGNHKEKWFDYMKDRGLIVKLAVDEQENVGGMIQCVPIEHSFAKGEHLYLIKCIWIHGYQKGRGDFRNRGMGKALIQAVEADVKSRNAKGLVAWGISLPFWMKASWFKKQGYRPVDKMGFLGRVLLWKPFTDDALPPSWIRQKKKPEPRPGKVTVTSFINGWCPAQNIVHERAKRASAEFGEQVDFNAVDTLNRDIFLEWGISDALFIDGKSVRTGPPPSYQKIKKLIARRVRKL
jgi:N-acetylglutamate synthase-like GNAT family acetyltransferase